MNRAGWLGLFAVLISGPATAQPTGPLPLDPLTPDEVRLAERVAREDARVRQLVGGNGRLIYVQFISVKLNQGAGEAAKEPTGRHAEVMFHIDPDRGGVRTLVDLTGSRVVDAVRVPERSVPIGQSDVEQAAQIALADAKVRRLLGDRADSFRPLSGAITAANASGNYVEGLHTIGVSPNDPCSRHRCIILLFTSNNRPFLTDQQVTVDLTTKKTMVEPRDRPGAQRHRHEGGSR
jgi:hypothetical protein